MASQFFSFVLFFVFAFASRAQETVNLVPNPSFEEFENGCPENYHELPIGWSKWRSSPNSFSTCVEPLTLVDSLGWAPWNSFSYQWPASGDSYVGMYAFSPDPYNDNTFREYIGCELLEPLEPGETYFISFKVNLAIGGAKPAPGFYDNPIWACSHMGLIFTDQAYASGGNPMPIPNFAHVYSETLITDTVDWVTISGSLVADQGFTHMSLGVFFEMDYLDTMRLQFIPGLNGLGAYFFADDVCVSKYRDCIAPPGIETFEDKSPLLELYPNPAKDSVRFTSRHRISNIDVRSISGQNVLSIPLGSVHSGELSVRNLCDGVYYVMAKTEKSTIREKLVVVH